MRIEKVAILNEVVTRVKDSDYCFIINHGGVTVAQFAKLRKDLRAQDSRLLVVKNSFLAKVANNLREQIRGVSACFVIGRTGEDTVSISARSDGTINVGLLTDKLGGGGQYDRAGAAFANVKVGLVESKLLDCLDTYLEEARSDLGGERI